MYLPKQKWKIYQQITEKSENPWKCLKKSTIITFISNLEKNTECKTKTKISAKKGMLKNWKKMEIPKIPENVQNIFWMCIKIVKFKKKLKMSKKNF